MIFNAASIAHRKVGTFLKRWLNSFPPVAMLARNFYFGVFGRYFMGSAAYWEARYQNGGTSGTGSTGALALYKAEIINRFVSENAIETVVEFGCGDGEQLCFARYPHYHGVDVSLRAVTLCRHRFGNDPTKTFTLSGSPLSTLYDLALSLDVIYHLVEDEVYELYMKQLFAASRRFIIIYSSNIELTVPEPHVRHRRFIDWIETNSPEWRCYDTIKNRYPFDPRDPINTSFADFYIFEKRA